MVLASGFIARGKADCSQERGGGGRAVCLSPEDNEGELRRKESPTQFSQAPPPPSDERKEGFFTPFPSCFHCDIQFLSGMYKKELRPSNNPLTRLFAHMRSSFDRGGSNCVAEKDEGEIGVEETSAEKANGVFPSS